MYRNCTLANLSASPHPNILRLAPETLSPPTGFAGSTSPTERKRRPRHDVHADWCVTQESPVPFAPQFLV